MTAYGILALLAVSGLNVELTTLDGRAIDGSLEEWTSNAIRIEGQEVATADAHRMIVGEAVSINGADQVAVLADGSRIIVDELSRERIDVNAKIGDRTIRMDADAIKAIRFAPLEDRFSATWFELLGRDQRDDLFVRQRGEALDHVNCVIGDFSNDGISLRVGSRDILVPKDKAFGVIFATKQPQDFRPAGRVLFSNGSSLMAKELKWSDDALAITSTFGFSLTVPADKISDEIAEIDLAAGRVELLSDLEPRSVTYSPFGDNYDEYAWKLRTNQNALGDRLRLGGERHPNGLWVHSGTTAVYSLPNRARRFSALVGIDEIEAPGEPVQLEILVDGRKSFDGVVAPNRPQSVEIDLANARQLTIVATTTKPDEHGIREHLAIVNARLILE